MEPSSLQPDTSQPATHHIFFSETRSQRVLALGGHPASQWPASQPARHPASGQPVSQPYSQPASHPARFTFFV